jgi:hypothetical protein
MKNYYIDIINSILNKDTLIIKSMTAVNHKFNINIINCWMEIVIKPIFMVIKLYHI